MQTVQMCKGVERGSTEKKHREEPQVRTVDKEETWGWRGYLSGSWVHEGNVV